MRGGVMDVMDFYTPAEVAKRYRVAESTVQRWIRNGWLSALDLGRGERIGPYIISREDMREFEKAGRRPCAGKRAGR